MIRSIALAKSLIFRDDRYIDPANPDVYYNHLQGTKSDDVVLYTTDVVTGSSIIFDKFIDKNYRETYDELLKFGKKYQELLHNYPKYRNYIRGCLIPVDKDTILKASHCEVIGYNKDLLEPQETNIIPEINKVYAKYIKKYNGNSLNTVIDKYHEIMVTANVSMLIPLTIYLTRILNKGTIRMLSYYLDRILYNKGISYGTINILTYNQKMWLYNNLDYINTSSLDNNIINKFIKHLFKNQPVYRVIANKTINNNNQVVSQPILTKLSDTIPVTSKTLNELKFIVENDNIQWISRDNNIDTVSLTGLYYLDNNYGISSLISPELTHNLWGNLAFSNDYRININFAYPFNTSSSKRYILNNKQAFIFIKALQRLLGDISTMPVNIEVNDSLTLRNPGKLNDLNLYIPSNITSLSSFLEVVNKIKDNYTTINNKLHLASTVDVKQYMAEFELYQSSKTYLIGGGSIDDWLKDNRLPKVDKKDIPSVIKIILDQTIGVGNDEFDKLDLLRNTFNDITPYNVHLLIKKPIPECNIPIISMNVNDNNPT